MEKKILISGMLNVETSLNVDGFPIEYSPIAYPFFGVNTCVSGVGFNIAKALKTLGDNVELLSIIGDDLNGQMILKVLEQEDIQTNNIVIRDSVSTCESVIFYDQNGKRKIYCDLKNIQETEHLSESNINLDEYSIAILTNINFNRDLLKRAKEKGLLVATDVHVLRDINDAYNGDFIKYADILFLSNEAVMGREELFIKQIYEKYHNQIIVMGCGENGALLYAGKEDKFYHQMANAPKGIKSTVGAGDALFSSFIHYYNKGLNLGECLRKSVLFAGLKISVSGGSNGFVNESELEKYLE